MTFDLQRIIESKRAWRRALAQRPVAEKLAMLDALRDRARTIRAATLPPQPARARNFSETPPHEARGLTRPGSKPTE